MAQIQSAGTIVSDGVGTGPLFQDQVDRLAAPYANFGPGMVYSTQYTHFITPYARPLDGGPIPWDVVPVTAFNIGAADAYLPLSNSNYPTSTQFVSSQTGRIGLQFDTPRCIGIQRSASLGVDLTVNIIGQDLYGFPMLEKIVIPAATAFVNPTLSQKAFYRLLDIWVSRPLLGNNANLSVRTANKFGLPYRLYSSGNSISLGLGAQAYSAVAVSAKAIMLSSAQINAATEQGFFYNDVNAGTANPITSSETYTAGPLHKSNARDVRGTLDFEVAPIIGWDPVLPLSICYTYVVLGYWQQLNRQYEARNRLEYSPQGVPDNNVIYPNALPILPNISFNPADIPASQLPTKLPLDLTNAFGVPQFYTTERGNV